MSKHCQRCDEPFHFASSYRSIGLHQAAAVGAAALTFAIAEPAHGLDLVKRLLIGASNGRRPDVAVGIPRLTVRLRRR
jgi:hypothetical protein